MITISSLNTKDYNDYTTFLTGQELSLLYLSTQYKSLLERLLDVQSDYLVARNDDGDIEGVLPLMIMDGPLGKVINSLPYYGSNGGILSTSKEASDALTQAYLARITKEDVLCSTLIESPFVPNSFKTKADWDFIDERIAQWTSLQSIDSEDALHQCFSSAAKRNIKKAIKNGITVSIENDQIEFLKRVHQENMTQINGLAKTDNFFQSFQDVMPPHMYDIFVARHSDNEPVAALLVIYFNNTVEYFLPAIVNQYRSDQPLALIINQAMCHVSQLGYTQWNWGGTWLTQENLRRFKNKWGAKEGHYRYFIKMNNPSLLSKDQAWIMDHYPGMYTVPFSKLSGST